MAVPKPETGPEGRAGYEGRPPILTNVRGLDQITLAGAIFEDPGQDLWWKPVGGNICVPGRPNRLQNLREITFDAIDLWTMRRLATDYIGILGQKTFWGCKSRKCLGNEVSRDDSLKLDVRVPSERRIWIQDLGQCAHELFEAELAAGI